MKHGLRILALLCSLSFGQTVQDYGVLLSATPQVSPPKITLNWVNDPAATTYSISRKPKTSSTWTVLATLSGPVNTWIDSTVSAGIGYEYRVVKTAAVTGYGYCYAGIEVPQTEGRGKLILVVDSTYISDFTTELTRLVEDLIGDGWQVIEHHVSRTDAVTAIKAMILADYTADPANTKGVFLLGHVPVPYSGNINPDGHSDHQGAWPADGYYGELTSIWQDASVNNSSASRPENRNIPGDGKFDYSMYPSTLELFVGRVDFANIPAFSLTEGQLLKRYLDKDHAFRHKLFTVNMAGLIDDNFGTFTGESFATSGWTNLSVLTGAANVVAGDYFSGMTSNSYLWSYGCGGGTYTSASGVGSTTNFVTDSVRSVFTMLFGSYHGDWDATNNFMRAALASKGPLLTCAWSGRPRWHFHHMGLGEVIGHSQQITAFNSTTYYVGPSGNRQVHIGLLGDPSLRMHVVAPASNFTVTPISVNRYNQLSWSASPEASLGYFIYRADSLMGTFVRISPTPITSLTFTDSCPNAGTNVYMVRALTLTSGNTGTYYNMSQGVFGSASNPLVLLTSNPPMSVYCAGDSFLVAYSISGPNCTGNTFSAELSDAGGSFGSPVVIGTDALGIGLIHCVVPGATPPGSGYRVRTVSALPAFAGPDNGTDIIINPLPVADFTFIPYGDSIQFSSTSLYATSQSWDFGDGTGSMLPNPGHQYPGTGTYTVVLIVSNACGTDTLIFPLLVTGLDDRSWSDALLIYPSPADDQLRLKLPVLMKEGMLTVTDSKGLQVIRQIVSGNAAEYSISTIGLPEGVYVLQIQSGETLHQQRFTVQHE